MQKYVHAQQQNTGHNMLAERLLWMVWAFITLYTTAGALVFTIFIMQDPLDTIKELAKDPVVLVIWLLCILVNIPLWNYLVTTYPF